jgi:hypothetical protein
MQFDQVRPRQFMALRGGAVAWALAAQQLALPVIG